MSVCMKTANGPKAERYDYEKIFNHFIMYAGGIESRVG
jgi:hypothetical protein